jgi:hypothetical protein
LVFKKSANVFAENRQKSLKLAISGWSLTSPPGAKLSPRSEFCPQGLSYPLGVKVSVRPYILLNSLPLRSS